MFRLPVDSCNHKKVIYQPTSLQFVLLETSFKFDVNDINNSISHFRSLFQDLVTVGNLVHFLKVFETATSVLSASKYPTVSLILLFRSEILAALIDLATDCAVVKSMKERMRCALNHRMPITEMHVAAAMLDPSQRNLSSVQDFLAEHNTNAVELLSRAVCSYVGDQQQAQSTPDGERGREDGGSSRHTGEG